MTARGVDEAASGEQVPNGALLASLGLPAGASVDEVRAVRDTLADYLAAAPPELRPWARQQLALAEGAHDLLAGSANATPAPVALPVPDDDAASLADVVGDDMDGNPFRWKRRTSTPPREPGGSQRSFPTALVLGMLAVGIVLGVYFMGDAPRADPGASTAATASAQLEAAQLDEARVAELTAAVTTNPDDVEALRELGHLHYAAGDFAEAALWQQRLVDIDPGDIDARLALGVALFSQGDLNGAEEHWLAAVKLDPDQAEVHYNLGFLYLSLDPPDMDRVREEWNRVIELDPGSDIAQTAATHLERLEAAATPSPTSTGD